MGILFNYYEILIQLICCQSPCLFSFYGFCSFFYSFLVFVSHFVFFARVFVPLVTPPPLTRLAKPRSESVPGNFSRVFLKSYHGTTGGFARSPRSCVKWVQLRSPDVVKTPRSAIKTLCNIRLLRSHMRFKKNRPHNHWLKSQGHYLWCFSTSKRSEPIRFTCDMRLRPVTA